MCHYTMKHLTTILLAMLLCSWSCEDELEAQEELTQGHEADRMAALFEEISDLATSVRCEDSSLWTYAAYGSKACGGPVGYIAYSTQIDTNDFLQKIEDHVALQKAFNEKWQIGSDCSLPSQPTGVICEDGEAILIY